MRSGSSSRSGSESPSHLRASLLEQKRRKSDKEVENDVKGSQDENLEEKISDAAEKGPGPKETQVGSPSGQKSAGGQGSILGKRTPRSSSSSPEPPPVIPRVHRSRFDIPPPGTGVDLHKNGTKTDASTLKTSGVVPPSVAGSLSQPPPWQPHPLSTSPSHHEDLSAIDNQKYAVAGDAVESLNSVDDVTFQANLQGTQPDLPPAASSYPQAPLVSSPPIPLPGSAPEASSLPMSTELLESMSIPLPPTPTDGTSSAILATALDPLQLSNVPLPGEPVPGRAASSEKTSSKKIAEVAETGEEKSKPALQKKSVDSSDSDSSPMKLKERKSRGRSSQSDKSRTSRSSSTSSSSSSSSNSSSRERKKTVLSSAKLATDKLGVKDVKKSTDSQKLQEKEKDSETTKKKTEDTIAAKPSETKRETVVDEKSKKDSEKKSSEKRSSRERDASKSKGPSGSSARSKRRSRSKDARTRKKSSSPVRRRSRSRSSSRRVRRSPPRRRSRSRSPRRRSPLRYRCGVFQPFSFVITVLFFVFFCRLALLYLLVTINLIFPVSDAFM